jgi:hypothetical protein
VDGSCNHSNKPSEKVLEEVLQYLHNWQPLSKRDQLHRVYDLKINKWLNYFGRAYGL